MKKTKKKQQGRRWDGRCSMEVRCDGSGLDVKVQGERFDPLKGVVGLTEGAARGVAKLAASVGDADASAMAETLAGAFAAFFEDEFARSRDGRR